MAATLLSSRPLPPLLLIIGAGALLVFHPW
jgi:hypothetical protein